MTVVEKFYKNGDEIRLKLTSYCSFLLVSLSSTSFFVYSTHFCLFSPKIKNENEMRGSYEVKTEKILEGKMPNS